MRIGNIFNRFIQSGIQQIKQRNGMFSGCAKAFRTHACSPLTYTELQIVTFFLYSQGTPKEGFQDM